MIIHIQLTERLYPIELKSKHTLCGLTLEQMLICAQNGDEQDCTYKLSGKWLSYVEEPSCEACVLLGMVQPDLINDIDIIKEDGKTVRRPR